MPTRCADVCLLFKEEVCRRIYDAFTFLLLFIYHCKWTKEKILPLFVKLWRCVMTMGGQACSIEARIYYLSRILKYTSFNIFLVPCKVFNLRIVEFNFPRTCEFLDRCQTWVKPRDIHERSCDNGAWVLSKKKDTRRQRFLITQVTRDIVNHNAFRCAI